MEQPAKQRSVLTTARCQVGGDFQKAKVVMGGGT